MKINLKIGLALITCILMLIIPIVYATSYTLPIYVRPLRSGSIQASRTFNYEFRFATDSACTSTLLNTSASITTDAYGIGFVEIDISQLNGTPSYLCEYKDDALRKVHNLSTGVFTNLYAAGNASITSPNGTTFQLEHDNSNAILSTTTGNLYLDPNSNDVYLYDNSSAFNFYIYDGTEPAKIGLRSNQDSYIRGGGLEINNTIYGTGKSGLVLAGNSTFSFANITITPHAGVTINTEINEIVDFKMQGTRWMKIGSQNRSIHFVNYNGTITADNGTISFNNENLITEGNLTAATIALESKPDISCVANLAGSIIWNATSNKHRGCDGTNWNDLY